MKIAQIAPLYESVPPKYYGGTERVVSYLTEELVRQGHDVTLFASGDSKTAAKLVRCCDMALRLNPIFLKKCGAERKSLTFCIFTSIFCTALWCGTLLDAPSRLSTVVSTSRMPCLSITSSENCPWSQSPVISANTCVRPIGSAPFITGYLAIFCHFSRKSPVAISPSLAASPQKSGPIGQSKSL